MSGHTETPNGGGQLRNIPDRRVVHGRRIHAPVSVYQAIAHALNLCPRHLRVRASTVFAQQAHRLPNDLDLTNDGIRQNIVLLKIVMSPTPAIRAEIALQASRMCWRRSRSAGFVIDHNLIRIHIVAIAGMNLRHRHQMDRPMKCGLEQRFHLAKIQQAIRGGRLELHQHVNITVRPILASCYGSKKGHSGHPAPRREPMNGLDILL